MSPPTGKSTPEVCTEKADELLTNLASIGREPTLSRRSYELICEQDIRGDNKLLAAVVCEIAVECQPITLRGLFYRVVSAGMFPSTEQKFYNKVGRLVTRLRRSGLMPYSWIVDSLRSTVKPSSWTGLSDFGDTVAGAYRKDFWHHLDEYVHVFVEKDAIAGVVTPVTEEYDVALSPVRGYCSESFAYQVGSQFKSIEKPVHCYYLGDHDPSGYDIERDLQKKLREISGRSIEWTRLAINADDFDRHDLVRLKPKKKDRRYKRFVEEHGPDCAEVDALHPHELRRRIRQSIEQWIPKDEWNKLKQVEEVERETFNSVLAAMGGR